MAPQVSEGIVTDAKQIRHITVTGAGRFDTKLIIRKRLTPIQDNRCQARVLRFR